MKIESIVRAVVQVEGHLLVCQVDGASHVFLPGGHVEFGEPVRRALLREFDEELGAAARGATVGAYLGSMEHAYEGARGRRHEVNHVFAASIPELRPATTPASPESYLSFRWLALDAAAVTDLRPRGIATFAGKSDTPRWTSTLETDREPE